MATQCSGMLFMDGVTFVALQCCRGSVESKHIPSDMDCRTHVMHGNSTLVGHSYA